MTQQVTNLADTPQTTDIAVMRYERLAEFLQETGSHDSSRIEATTAALDTIAKDFEKFSKYITQQMSTYEASNVSDNRGEGFMGFVKYYGHNALQLSRVIPGVGTVIDVVVSVPPHVAMQKQYELAVNLEGKLKDLVYSPTGTRATIDRIYAQRTTYAESVRKIRDNLEIKVKEGEAIYKKIKEQASKLKSKHGTDYLKDDLSGLNKNAFKIYQTITKLREDKKKNELFRQEESSKIMVMMSYLAGTEQLGQIIEALHNLGHEMHGKMNSFLTSAQPNIAIFGDVSQIEDIIVKCSKVTNDMAINFNAGVEMISYHLNVLSEHADTLIPTHLYHPESLVRSMKHIEKANKNLLEHIKRREELAKKSEHLILEGDFTPEESKPGANQG